MIFNSDNIINYQFSKNLRLLRNSKFIHLTIILTSLYDYSLLSHHDNDFFFKIVVDKI